MQKAKGGTFDLTLDQGKARIKRNISFSGGDSISFEITVGEYESLTLAQLHRKSAKMAIDMLEEWLSPEQAPK